MYFQNLEKTITSTIPNLIKTTIQIITGKETKKKLFRKSIEELAFAIFLSKGKHSFSEGKRLWKTLQSDDEKIYYEVASILIDKVTLIQEEKEILDRNPYSLFLVFSGYFTIYNFVNPETVGMIFLSVIEVLLFLSCYFDYKDKKRLIEVLLFLSCYFDYKDKKRLYEMVK